MQYVDTIADDRITLQTRSSAPIALRKAWAIKERYIAYPMEREYLKSIEESSMLKNQWEKYRREYSYAKDIVFEDTIKAIKKLIDQ